MSNNQRRGMGGVVGMAVGALLAVPLLASPIAGADPADETTTTDDIFGLGLITETVTNDPDLGDSDTFISTPFFDNDFLNLPSDNIWDDLVTIPGVAQFVFVGDAEAPFAFDLFDSATTFAPDAFLGSVP